MGLDGPEVSLSPSEPERELFLSRVSERVFSRAALSSRKDANAVLEPEFEAL